MIVEDRPRVFRTGSRHGHHQLIRTHLTGGEPARSPRREQGV
ncbi:hypothetical protein [Amycolatopsis sp. lyj-23]